MQLHPDGTIVVSATDLVGFLECDHLATLELGRARGLWAPPPHRTDPTLDLLRQKGEEHERRFLERQRAAGRTITEIARPDRMLEGLTESAERTLEAMRRGDDVIFQATLFDGRWLGYADFLLRVGGMSSFGSWSYEVADTKLSRAVKGGAVLQVCVYSDLLAQVQGVAPLEVHVVTGDGEMQTMRLDDYAAYYRAVKQRFERDIFGDAGTLGRDPASVATYPDPVEHCRVCSWYPDCADWRRTDDHLSIVAGLARTATEHLNADGIWTRRSLAILPPAQAVPDLNPRTLTRLREQAAIQVRGEDEQRLIWELIPPDPEQPGQGLARLPEPSRLDLFFDIEADPWAAEDGTGFGLEYLLGVVDVVDDEPNYTAIWGTDRDGERVAFERFIDVVVERRRRDPDMHVFHYGGYESGAVKRLMQRHATRAEEVDQLLRDEVFVDLLAIVRQGLRASVESYSLKRIEKFYMSERTGPVTEAGFSVVEFEAWLADGQQRHLDDLAAYNKDDCVSTLLLRDWLEGLRRIAIDERGWAMPRPTPPATSPNERLLESLEETRRREDALRAGISADPARRTPDEQGRWLLSRLIDWHRREDRPQWWNWYRLRDMAVEDLVDERESVSGLEFVADLGVRARSTVRRYRFPPQETKLHAGDEPFDPDDGEKGAGAGEIAAIDLAAGTLDLVRGPKRLDRHPVRLIPARPFANDAQRRALGLLAELVIEQGIDVDGPLRAGRDLLLRRPPRLTSGYSVGPLDRAGESGLDTALRLGLEVDRGVLGIQGPPGTGKTWTGARMALALVATGRRIGVTSQAHKAITNMLIAIDDAARASGQAYRAVQKCDPGDDAAELDAVTTTSDAASVGPAMHAGRYDIAAGTPWLFARTEMVDAVDVLFVDEAGQMALANVLAVSAATKSIVLLGDPNQLPQVTQGVHPEGADASALGHLIGDAVTVPRELGLLLDTTYRMHPAVNDYISKTFYAGRVRTAPSTLGQSVEAGQPGGVGIRWRPIEHAGNDSSSTQEAQAVVDALAALVGREWTDEHGHRRLITTDDIVVVAPYNLQVAAIEAAARARGITPWVGTVDKFQGQEGAVAIYSMTSSSAEDAPRGMDFLYERNRLNVAISRARALAILVASPELLRVHCRTPEQMTKANALCAYLEMADAAGD
ncbi:MAG: TM0106 family RecB-like putative nuclease [Candidatus Limnocylindrales bacterium]